MVTEVRYRDGTGHYKTKGHKEIFHEDRNVILSKLTKLNVRPVYFIIF